MADVTLIADLNIPGDLLIDNGFLYLNGFDLTVGGTLTINDFLAVQGSEIITVNGVAISTNKLDVHADVVLGASWGIDFRGVGSVLVDSYSTAFFNIAFGAGKTHNFTAGLPDQITVNGDLSTDGVSLDQAILRSSIDGDSWFIVLNGTSSLGDGVDVKNSDADNGLIICAGGSTDTDDNSNWGFDMYCGVDTHEVTPIDHTAQVDVRIITQYRETVKLLGYIKALVYEANTIELACYDMLNKRTLDDATAFTLDIIGELVGSPRAVPTTSDGTFFGFLGSFNSDTFGSVANPATGGVFKSAHDPDDGFRLLTDDEYRLYIRSKILTNTTLATPEDIIAALRFLFNLPSGVKYTETTDGYSIETFDALTNDEKFIITQNQVIPKSVGFEVTYIFA